MGCDAFCVPNPSAEVGVRFGACPENNAQVLSQMNMQASEPMAAKVRWRLISGSLAVKNLCL
jgi:hypothetical protein